MVQVRKRAAVNYAEPGNNPDGLEADSDEEQEQDREPRATVPTPQARKAAVNKPRARKRSATEAAADLDDASLLDIVKRHGTSITVAAKDWVDQYKEGRAAATAQLLTFLLQSCGVDHVLSEEAVEEGEVDQLKQELDKQAQEEGLEEHWRAKGAKHFRGNYLEMWDKLMREAHAADCLFDQFLLDKLVSLLISLNTSVVREFRAVATLTAAQLVTSWIHVSLTLGEARDTAERQLAAEEKKKGNKAAADRVASFKRTVDRCHARIQELKSFTDSLFQGIFAHRFRDCSEEIRATVIEGIGSWVRLHPSAFLTDQYLKYIAWALSDKDSRVRSASVTALLSLYSNPDNKATLHDFTQRFQQRFGELFYDKDEAVAVKGVQLNTLLVRLKEASATQFAQVYELLADESHAVRHAVAELVATMLEEQGQQVLQQQAEGAAAGGKKGGKKQRRKSGEGGSGSGAWSTSELQLAGLLQVMHLLANPPPDRGGAAGGGEGGAEGDEGEDVVPLEREVVAQVVDALFDRVPMLSDWHLLLGWAQQGNAEAHFGEAGLTNLLHLLRDALCKATGAQLLGPVDRKQLSKEKQQAQAAARQDATLALMKELPALLRKVQTDPAQAAALVGAIPEMKLEIYSLKRQEKAFAQLATSVKDTFLKHAEQNVAKECISALAACARTGPDSIKDAAQLALSECADEVSASLATAVAALEKAGSRRVAAATQAYDSSGGQQESQLLFDSRAALVRLHALLALSGGAAEEEGEVHEALNSLLESAASGEALPAPIVRSALLSMLLVLMWRLRALDSDFPEPAALADLAHKRSLFTSQLESIAECSASQEVRDEVTSVMADAYLVFASSKYEGSAVQQACFEPSDDSLHAFWQQCQAILRRDIQADEEDDSGAISQKMAAQRAAATKVAQLVVFAAVPQHAWLAAHLVSQWVGPEAAVSEGLVRRWAPVADIVKEAARLLKKTSAAAMPNIYLEALKCAHDRIQHAAVDDDIEGEEVPGEQEFLALSDRIAKTYAGFNSSASALEHIIVEGAKHALRGGADHLSFLEGVAFFVRALPAARADGVRQRVEAAAAPHQPQEAEDSWETYYAFLECIAKRAAKGRVKSVLKKAEAAAGSGGAGVGPTGSAGATSKKAPRKISFAPAERIEEESEEEEEEGEEREHIEEADEGEGEDEERPSSLRRVLPRSSQRGTLGRLSGMAPSDARGSRRPAAAAAAVAETDDEAEQEEEEEEGGRDEQYTGVAGEDEEEEADEEAASELAEDDGEEEDEGPVVLPTEEAMAIPAGRSGGGGKQRQRRLQPVFEVDEDQEEQEGSETEDDDADLQVLIRGRSTAAAARGGGSGGGSQRQAAVVDEQPELAAAAAGEDGSDEEEERPARRRRRR